jgi:hypothetical protein
LLERPLFQYEGVERMSKKSLVSLSILLLFTSLMNSGCGRIWSGAVRTTSSIATISTLTNLQYNNSLVQSPTFSWILSSGSLTGVDHFEYSIGSSTGATDVSPWTSSGMNTSVTASGLTLNSGVTYFLSVRASLKSGSYSNVLNSSWTVSLIVLVNALYSNAPNWMDFVKNNGADIYSATPVGVGTACVGTEVGNGASGCIHGAEKRVAQLPAQFTSCTGLTATDSLGAFDWVCKNNAGTIYFYTYRLKINKGLKDLISNAPAFIPISLSISAGSGPIIASNPAVWWTNTLTPIAGGLVNAAGSTNLPGLGTIYVLTSTTSVGAYAITADKVGVVVLKGATMQFSGYAGVSLITSAAGKYYPWMEGTFDGAGATPAIRGLDFFNSANFGNVRQASFAHFSDSGLVLNGSPSMTFVGVLNSFNGVNGFYLQNTNNYAYMESCTAFRNTSTGFNFNSAPGMIANNLMSSSNNGGGLQVTSNGQFTMTNLKAFNNGGGGFFFGVITGSVISNVLSVGNTGTGLSLSGDTSCTLTHYTGVNNSNIGLDIRNSSQTLTLNNLLTVNNGGDGLEDFSIANGAHVINNVASLNNVGNGVYLQNALNDTFSGTLVTGNNGGLACQVFAGTNPGLVATTCTGGGTAGLDGSNTYPGFPSTAVLRVGKSGASSFFGKVGATDSANASNTSGTQLFAGITDWINFSSIYRGWGLDGGAFPNVTNQGMCAAGTCRIWDFRLSASDTTVRNTTIDGASANSAFVAGAACPAFLNGNITLTDAGAAHTFLMNAQELVGDSVNNPTGNNNGLCEAGEGCVYTPNYGSYQGEGALTSPCTFNSNGGLAGITIYSYSNNGI